MNTRASTSVAPPAPNGTMTLTGAAGYVCAMAVAADSTMTAMAPSIAGMLRRVPASAGIANSF